MAVGGSGDEPVTEGSGRRSRANIVLFVVTLLVACGCVLGAGLVVREHRNDERAAGEQARYGDVLSAARSEVEALINIDYRNPEESMDAVAEGATGDFADQYDTKTDGVLETLKENESVMDGEVLWAGVVDLDSDSATVIAATQGTVANVSTQGKPVARGFRVKLDLVHEDGEWRTRNLEFVG